MDAFVAVGSSLEPMRRIPSGLRRLHRKVHVLAASRFWLTPALDRPEDPDFVNGMVRVRTDLSPLRLRRLLHGIEADEGRTRTADPMAPRTLDLDLVAYGGQPLDRDLPLRRFLAVPMLDLEPNFEILPGVPLQDPGGMDMEPVPSLTLESMLQAPPAIPRLASGRLGDGTHPSGPSHEAEHPHESSHLDATHPRDATRPRDASAHGSARTGSGRLPATA